MSRSCAVNRRAACSAGCDALHVVSGFSERSDWLHNLAKTPQTIVQGGRRRPIVVSLPRPIA